MDDAKRTDLFENKPIIVAVLAMALPSIIGQIILVIYNMADTLFVGLTENHILINAVTICMPAYMILTAISNLFGVGGSSVIARSLGKGNEKRARRASSFAFWGCLLVSLIYCAIIAIFAENIAHMLGANDAETINHAAYYLRIAVAICGVPTAINTLFSHLIRSQGLGFHASFGIALGGILNVALDPLFIFVICGKENAAVGAALATGISNVIALLYYVFVFIFLRKKLIVDISFTKKIFKDHLIQEVLLIGLPACLMTLFENISYAILGNQMGALSAEALTGVEVAKKVNMFAHNAVRGMAQGVLPLIGYNKSSGNRRRMRKIVYTSGAISLGIALVAMIINMIPFTGRGLISLFLHGGVENLEIRQNYAYWFLFIFSIGAPFSAIAYTVISFFQAVGKAWRSLILALLRKGILDIPLMFILQALATMDFKPYSITMATPIADIICCLVAVILFAVYIKYHGHNKKDLNMEQDITPIDNVVQLSE